MSRKDYIALADALRAVRPENGFDEHTRRECVLRVAEVLAAENPHFDRGRFLSACGFEPKPDNYSRGVA